MGNFPRDVPDAPDRKLWQLTSSGGLESDASWAPNGHAIAYSSDRDGNFDIWSQPFAIAPNQMILPIVEASGSVWVLENIDR